MEALKERLRALLPDASPTDALLEALLQQSQALVLNYTGRRTVPPALEGVVVELAVCRYNRLGAEGEALRHEGGLHIRFEDLPPSLLCQLRPFRLGRAVGP